MPTIGSIASNVLILRWKKRRREILQRLTPTELAEYKKLGQLIKGVREEERKVAKKDTDKITAAKPPAATHDGFFQPARIPLAAHKKKLIDFLRENGPTSRGEITAKTHIPPGSLSYLLQHPEFEQHEHGVWRLKGQAK